MSEPKEIQFENPDNGLKYTGISLLRDLTSEGNAKLGYAKYLETLQEQGGFDEYWVDTIEIARVIAHVTNNNVNYNAFLIGVLTALKLLSDEHDGVEMTDLRRGLRGLYSEAHDNTLIPNRPHIAYAGYEGYMYIVNTIEDDSGFDTRILQMLNLSEERNTHMMFQQGMGITTTIYMRAQQQKIRDMADDFTQYDLDDELTGLLKNDSEN